MLSNCVRYHVCVFMYVQKYENQIVLGAVFILEEKCVPLKKWFITKSTFYVSTMGWNLFWRNILYKLCYQKIADKLFGSKKGRNILWNRIGIEKKYAIWNLFQPIVSCNTCTEQPLFIPCYLSSKYKYLYKKNL